MFVYSLLAEALLLLTHYTLFLYCTAVSRLPFLLVKRRVSGVTR